MIKRADGMYAVHIRRPPLWSPDARYARRFFNRDLAAGQIKFLLRQPAMQKIGMEVVEVEEA